MKKTDWIPAAIVTGVTIGLLLLAALGTLWLLLKAGTVLKLLAVALLLALALSPLVDRMERRRIPRGLALVLMLVLLLAVIAGISLLLIPQLAEQVTMFINNLPDYWAALQDRTAAWLARFPYLEQAYQRVDLAGALSARAQGLLAAAGNVASWVAATVTSLVLVAFATVFMLANPRPLLEGALAAIPDRYQEQVRAVASQSAAKLRAWVQGILILSAVIGIASGVGLTLLGVPYAVLFGLLAAVLEVVPTLGPVLAAIPPVLVALIAISPLTALYTALLFVGVQQVESAVLSPLVMSKKLEMHPLSALVALLVMGSLLGIFGAVIALPVLAVLKVVYDTVYLPLIHPPRELEAEAELPPAEESP